MVSGSTKVDQAFFDKYYKPMLDVYVKNGCSFYVGGAKGIDTMTQQYLLDIGYDTNKVTIVDKGEQDNRLSDKFQHKNGFRSYPERDYHMTENTDNDCVTICQYGGGGSGTFANVVRRDLGDKTARRVQKLFRKYAEEYEE